MSRSSRVRVRAMPEWTPLSPGIFARCLLEERGTALMLYRVGPGRRFEPHDHDSAELGVVLSGTGRLLLASESRTVRAGDAFFFAPGTSHGFETPADGGEAVSLNAVIPLELGVPRPLIESIWGRAAPAWAAPPVRPTRPRPRRRD